MKVNLKYLKLIALFALFSPLFVAARTEFVGELDCNIRAKSQSLQAGEVKAAALIGEENRKTFDQFADAQNPLEKLNEAFAASGVINCGSETSAQVTGSNDVITTAMHVFFDKECNKRAGVENCYFYRAEEPSKKYPLEISTLKTAKDIGKCYSESRYYDWAVVKLKDPVEGINPYAIPTPDQFVKEGDKVVTVSTGDDNFSSSGSNIQICNIRATWHFDRVPIQTDCDTGAGSSGAAQFLLPSTGLSLDPEKLVMLSMNVAQVGKAVEGAEFNIDTQYNISVPVETDFLAALKSLAGK